jgi:hypothetical protein
MLDGVDIAQVDAALRGILEQWNIPNVNRPRLHRAMVKALLDVVPQRKGELPKKEERGERVTDDEGEAA